MFETISDILRIENPSNCLFVDDSIRNKIMCEEFGFKFIHFTNSSNLIKQLEQYRIFIT